MTKDQQKAPLKAAEEALELARHIAKADAKVAEKADGAWADNYAALERRHKDLLRAAANASLALGAIYDWVDKVNAAGGATSISGLASCHAMLSSLNKNRDRLTKSVIDPVNAAIEATQ